MWKHLINSYRNENVLQNVHWHVIITGNNIHGQSSFVKLINIGIGVEYFFNSINKNLSIVLDANYFLNGSNENNFTFNTISSSTDAKVSNEIGLFSAEIKFRKYWLLNKSSYFFANLGLGSNNFSGNTKYIINSNNLFFAHAGKVVVITSQGRGASTQGPTDCTPKRAWV